MRSEDSWVCLSVCPGLNSVVVQFIGSTNNTAYLTHHNGVKFCGIFLLQSQSPSGIVRLLCESTIFLSTDKATANEIYVSGHPPTCIFNGRINWSLLVMWSRFSASCPFVLRDYKKMGLFNFCVYCTSARRSLLPWKIAECALPSSSSMKRK